ncbi:MAG: hypothetical protein LBN04_10975 [Oscillospiraceae bacterium]|jgi:hypothetical protein|nr:hypothetical protein [Oscillospiraceae bacterium]
MKDETVITHYKKATGIFWRKNGKNHPSTQTALENAHTAYNDAGIAIPFAAWIMKP